MSEKSYVSTEQNVCIICGNHFDTGAILLDKRMRESMERHTTTGTGICPDDQKKYKAGYIALVGIDPVETPISGNTITNADAYRTGELAHLRISVWEQIFDSPVPLDEDGEPLPMAFVEDGVIKMLSDMVPTESKEAH